MKKIHLFAFLTMLLTPAVFSFAQTSCGTITSPIDIFGPNPQVETRPIIDCDNPFGVTGEVANPYTLTIDGTVVSDGAEVTVEGGTRSYEVSGRLFPYDSHHSFYRHEGQDYVYFDINPSTPSEGEYRNFAEAYFPEGTDVEPFVQAAVSGENEDLTISQRNQFFEFLEYVDENFDSQKPLLTPGTYTLVSHSYELTVSDAGVLDWFKNLFVPTAHAQSLPDLFHTTTFEIVEQEPEPQGASSVLFLPGIMGSHLYEESDVCDNQVEEQQRWFSRDECDQLRLSMDESGASINDVYPKGGQSAVVDEAYIFNLYKTLLSELSDWKSNGTIIDYAAVAYDWRLRLDEILQSTLNEDTGQIRYEEGSSYQDGYLYQELMELVNGSASGKVTIVAHSNGGLVAKQLIKTMQDNDDPLISKIDNLIMVGVPQTGTPDALVGILHGTEVGPGGFVVSQMTARTLMNDMPFAYHLLPTDSYFDGSGASVSTSVINFESGEITTPLANTFGTTITGSEAMHTFLGESSDRIRPEKEDLATPELGNELLIDYAAETATLQSNWVPPTSLKVYQIAGTGLDTPSGLTYFTDQECVSRSILQLFRCTEYAAKLGYRISTTIDGDQTVVVPSALAMSESEQTERVWLNFELYNQDSIIDRKHKDILEVNDAINFIIDILNGTSTTYEYITFSEPELINKENERLVFQLHSPLDMFVRDESGNEISSSTVTIEGGTYLRYGELQYISMPDTGDGKTLLLNGLAEGSFTLDIETYDDEAMLERRTYSGVPSGTSTAAELQFTDSESLTDATLEVDYEQDGVIDISYDEKGVIEHEVTYQTLIAAIEVLDLRALSKKSLLATAKLAEKHHERSLTKPNFASLEKLTLLVLKQMILLHNHRNAISDEDSATLIEIIQKLQ